MSITNSTTGIVYPTVAAAMSASSAFDVIALSPGLYVEEFPLITHSLTIEGVGGFAQLMTPGPVPANNRAILFVAGNSGADLTVRNLELSGARDPAANGAGILFEVGNRNLNISRSWFHDNEDGVLGGGAVGSNVTITLSEFDHNGLAPGNPRYGLSHNLYLNEFDSVTVTDSYFHDALGGHEIKSRALATNIIDNRIQDGPTADTSYSIDIPNGGTGVIRGNVIEQGASAINRYAIHYGGEPVGASGQSYPGSSLVVEDNLLINHRLAGGTAIYNQSNDAGGQSYPAIVTGNTAWNFDQFYRDRFGAIGPLDVVAGNALLTGSAPALDTSHPWDEVMEPASASLLAVALFATAALRRRTGRD